MDHNLWWNALFKCASKFDVGALVLFEPLRIVPDPFSDVLVVDFWPQIKLSLYN